MKLLIVESPKKAKEISHFLGKDFTVKATMGHFKDLPKDELGFDLQTFEPFFKISDSKHSSILKEIKDLSKKVDEIIIATDPDREGYAIGYMMFQELKKTSKAKIKRAEFREITKDHLAWLFSS